MLDKIEAQEGAVAFLKNTIKKGKIAHAYIFAGPSGVGKYTAAKAFVAGICCKNLLEDSIACGKCSNCVRIKNGNYPYLLYIEPDGAAVKIKQIREIQNFLKFKAQDNAYRFIIIDKAHTMTTEASNSLLKALEEPPSKTCIILVSDNLNVMLPTVISRGQIVNFNKLPSNVIKNILRNNEYNAEEVSAAAAVSQGSVGKALELIKDENVQTHRREIIKFLAAFPVSVTDIFDFSKKVNSEIDIYFFIEIVLSYYRDVLIWNLTGKEGDLTNTDFIFIIKSNNNISNKSLSYFVHHILKSQKAVLDNANSQLIIETLLLKLNEQTS